MHYYLNQNDTIVAIITPPGIGAVAVIRLSGSNAVSIVDSIFKGKKALSTVSPNSVNFGNISNRGEILDEVLVTFFKAPHSYTGEDIIEIACHGSVHIQHTLLQWLVEKGARLAQPGEFTQRAFFNEKKDLLQAEAVADLIFAENASAHRMALHQLKGGFSKELNALRQHLIDFSALLELELDFSQEDVEFADRVHLLALLHEIKATVGNLIASFTQGNAIKQGIPVAIAGKPNAGKSTLLNAILNEDRAIVSAIPGTTRDTIEAYFYIDGVKFRIIDTAGLRETNDEIERIGVSRSHASIATAYLMLYVFDATHFSTLDALLNETASLPNKPEKTIYVANKCDLLELSDTIDNEIIQISAQQKIGIEKLKTKIYESSGLNNQQINSTVVSNIRHLEALKHIEIAINDTIEDLQKGTSADLVAIHLRQALYHIGVLTGDVSIEDVLSSVFSRFCIGK